MPCYGTIPGLDGHGGRPPFRRRVRLTTTTKEPRMGADRSRRRSRTRVGQAVAVLMALGALMAGGAGATTQTATTARNHGLITGEVDPPKTVRQCEERFGTKNAHERYLRTKCIKRVEHELATAPGTSCTHPLEFNRGLEGGNGSPRYLRLT